MIGRDLVLVLVLPRENRFLYFWVVTLVKVVVVVGFEVFLLLLGFFIIYSNREYGYLKSLFSLWRGEPTIKLFNFLRAFL